MELQDNYWLYQKQLSDHRQQQQQEEQTVELMYHVYHSLKARIMPHHVVVQTQIHQLLILQVNAIQVQGNQMDKVDVMEDGVTVVGVRRVSRKQSLTTFLYLDRV